MSIKSFIKKGNFYHCFQPIFNLRNRERMGYEVLLRSDEYPNPEVTFQEAKKAKRLFELDSRSIHKAILTYQSAGFSKIDGNLFINILPSTILNPKFSSFLQKIIEKNNLKNQQIVLEISEKEHIEDFDEFKSQIFELKKMGFLIAIDDFGSGNSDFKSIIELEPNYIKLDRYLAYNLDKSKQKQSIVSFFRHFCKQYNCQMILEGLETPAEMEMAKALGVTAAQGIILGKPGLLNESV